MNKNLYILLVGIVLILLQLLLQGTPSFLSGKINLSLVVLIILVNLADFSWTMVFAVVTGLIMDIYSGLPFGVMTLALFLAAVVTKILFLNFFTNLSFYSLLLLGLITVVVYNLFFITIVALIYVIGASDYLPPWDYFYRFIWQLFTTESIMVVSYFMINRLSRRFKPVFLG